MPPRELPLVSICIPTYNRAARLQRAVERLLAGSYPALEIVISDNASTDATPEVAAQLGRLSDRVRYFRHASNQGPTPNFEFARSQARGKYFVWHGDDDYLAPDYIARCVQQLEQDPSLVLVSGLGAYHAGDGRITRRGNIVRVEQASPAARIARYLLAVEDNSIFCGVYRTDRVARCAFPNALAGDWAWLVEVLEIGRARVLPDVHIYREEGDNSSATLERNVAILGVPRWHARRPWFAIPCNLANHFAFRSATGRARPLPVRLWRWGFVFSVAFLKQMVLWVGPKLPGVTALWQRAFGPRSLPPPTQ